MIADEVLARRVQTGDRSAVHELVERHYDALIGYLYRLNGGDRQLAEDLVHDTFVRALAAIGQYQYPRPFKPWLYAIATNLTRNHYTSADSRRTTSAEDDLAALPSADRLDEPLDAEAESQAVARALASLPDHQREVILLFYYQAFSQNEIAEALHIPVGTVKSRLSIGVSRLRDYIRREAHELE